MFKTNRFLLGVAVLALLFSVSSCDDENDFSAGDRPGDVTETINTNFKFITINPSSIYSDPSSITHVSHGGTVTADIYTDANGSTYSGNIGGVSIIGDKLFLTKSSLNSLWYLNTYIEVLDTATFKSEKVYDFEYNNTGVELDVNNSAMLDGNRLFCAGPLNSDTSINNAAVLSLDKNQVESSFRLDFSVTKVIKSGDKLFIAGTAYSTKSSAIAVMDADNVSPEGIRIISDKVCLFSGHSSMLIDSKGKIWTAIYSNDGPSVVCIDPTTEQVVKTIQLPSLISSLSDVGIAIDRKAANLYVRCGRAFYHIDTEKCETPDDVVFEITSEIVNGGIRCVDLKMTHDDKLLFIHSVSDKGKKSRVYELNPASWTVENIYETNINSSMIYVAE